MKYLSQFLIILGFTFLGEALQRIVPLSIPASIYGLVLLFLSLCLKIVKLEQVAEAGAFLRSVMPVLFVAPAVNILESWGLIAGQILPILLLTVGTTVSTFGIAGSVTKLLRKGGEPHD